MNIIKRLANLKMIQVVSSIALVFALSILDLKKAQAIDTSIVGKLDVPFGDGANIAIEGDLALVSDEQIGEFGGGFFIIDISDPTDPVLLSQTQLAVKPEDGIATDITVRDNLAFVTVYKADNKPPFNLEDGLAVFDISNSANPEFRSNVEFPTAVISDIAVSSNGINIFYSSNPDREELSIGLFDPSLGIASLITTRDIPGGASCVAVTSTGLGVVVGDRDENPQTSTLSIFNPVTQTIIGSINFTGNHMSNDFDPFGVVVSENDHFAFVSGGFLSNEIVVIDISDTTAPAFVSSVATNGGNAFGISLAADLLFVTNALAEFPNSLLTIVDVTNPANPFVVDAIDPQGVLVDVATRTDGRITAVTANADFTGLIPGTPPGGITVLEVAP